MRTLKKKGELHSFTLFYLGVDFDSTLKYWGPHGFAGSSPK